MSSDDYFEDELDSAFLNEVDAIEAAHVSPPKAKSISYTKRPSRRPATTPDVIEIEDSDDFGDFSLDDAAFQQIDQVCADKYRELHQQGVSNVQPIAGPSKGKLTRTASKGAQMTLFGDLGYPSREKTKQWDHTAFAKTGWRKPKESTEKEVGKGKGKLVKNDDDEPLEFEQFPAPVFSDGPPPPMKLAVDRLAAKTWIYPLNQSRRDYQFNIVKRCLYENTLVALPTGLGKTFIAGVVMLNFYTWFPEGKVVFVAPSKPLVAQQIDACHKTCGIPGSCAAELTGSVPQTRRIDAWREKRVFYMTPQTLLNDLVNERCDPRDIVLLVFDEAHRATGEYAYVQVVRYMMAKNPHFRVLALSATPGGNV
ncbi:hypothetical protein A0H81_00569 [Grifola frondosa]|uniref:ATP-dependent DNA helicase n=1 Tax=Grifola frondosa TaxID=5627 RepID=A0A1C7MS76_GRIFR|nr:hypothetical protein A0H81_00569 [Grifola frondosa]